MEETRGDSGSVEGSADVGGKSIVREGGRVSLGQRGRERGVVRGVRGGEGQAGIHQRYNQRWSEGAMSFGRGGI